MNNENINYDVLWHKTKDAAKIPSKRDEDAGFDIYTTEDEVLLMPLEIHLFETGLQSAFSKDLVGIVKERGSTGCAGLAVRSGVIDSGFRGEWKILIQNLNPYPVKFTKQFLKSFKASNEFYYDHDGKQQCGDIYYYTLSKAIAQVIFFPLANVNSVEADVKQWNTNLSTQRGETMLGQSGK